MQQATFIRQASVAAFIGGGSRMVLAFIPWQDSSPWLEAAAALIDLAFLLALAGLFVATARRSNGLSLLGILLAFAGVASILGPDAHAFGLDFYWVGGTAAALGLALMSAGWLFARVGPIPSAIAWLLMLPAAALPGAFAATVPGFLFGAGFLLAGVWLIRQPQEATSWT